MRSALLIFIVLSLLAILLFLVEKSIFTPFKGTAKSWLHHSDEHGRHVTFKSRHNSLNGWFYGEKNVSPKGLIIFSHGMGVTSEYYLPEILYYAAEGYKVFAFDNTGYGANRGQFLGFWQAVRDLQCAIDYADDGALPVTLIGHSMGGYAVCCVLKYLNLSKHPIKNIVTYAALDHLPEVALDFLNARGSFIRTLFAKIICFGQFLLFGMDAYVKASELVDQNQQIQFIMIHGDHDDEIGIDTASLISKDYTGSNVVKMIISDPEINTHMGVVRKNGVAANGINREIVERIMEKR